MGLFKQLKIGDNIGYTYSGKLEPLSFKYACFGGYSLNNKIIFDYSITDSGDILVWTQTFAGYNQSNFFTKYTDYSHGFATVEVDFGLFKKTYNLAPRTRIFWERVFKSRNYDYDDVCLKNFNTSASTNNSNIVSVSLDEYLKSKFAVGFRTSEVYDEDDTCCYAWDYVNNKWSNASLDGGDGKLGFVI